MAGWLKAHDYDLVVIGAGSAGVWASQYAARLGARVALVERQRIGGDCTHYGCVPSKALLKAAGEGSPPGANARPNVISLHFRRDLILS